MPVRFAADIEAIRLRELFGIAIRRADAQRDGWALCDRSAADVGIDRSHTIAELVRAFEAQAFFYRAFDQRRLALQRGALVGPFAERHEPVADQLGGGLVTGIEDKDAVLQQFGF